MQTASADYDIDRALRPRHVEAGRLHRGDPRPAAGAPRGSLDRAARRPGEGPRLPGRDDSQRGQRRHRGMVRAFAVELAPIRVNALHPGIVGDSPAWSARTEALDAIRKRTPTGRTIDLAEMADGVLFLLENRCRERGQPDTGRRLAAHLRRARSAQVCAQVCNVDRKSIEFSLRFRLRRRPGDGHPGRSARAPHAHQGRCRPARRGGFRRRKAGLEPLGRPAAGRRRLSRVGRRHGRDRPLRRRERATRRVQRRRPQRRPDHVGRPRPARADRPDARGRDRPGGAPARASRPGRWPTTWRPPRESTGSPTSPARRRTWASSATCSAAASAGWCASTGSRPTASPPSTW